MRVIEEGRLYVLLLLVVGATHGCALLRENENRQRMQEVSDRKRAEDAQAQKEAEEDRKTEERQNEELRKFAIRQVESDHTYWAFLKDSKGKGIEGISLPSARAILADPESVKDRDLVFDLYARKINLEAIEELPEGGLRFTFLDTDETGGHTGNFCVEAPFRGLAKDYKHHLWNRSTVLQIVARYEGVLEGVNGLGMRLVLPKLRAIALNDRWRFMTTRGWTRPEFNGNKISAPNADGLKAGKAAFIGPDGRVNTKNADLAVNSISQLFAKDEISGAVADDLLKAENEGVFNFVEGVLGAVTDTKASVKGVPEEQIDLAARALVQLFAEGEISGETADDVYQQGREKVNEFVSKVAHAFTVKDHSKKDDSKKEDR